MWRKRRRRAHPLEGGRVIVGGAPRGVGARQSAGDYPLARALAVLHGSLVHVPWRGRLDNIAEQDPVARRAGLRRVD